MLSLHLTTSSLIAVRGEGSEEPFLQGQGNERQSVTKLEGYVKGGLAPLHYGTIKYHAMQLLALESRLACSMTLARSASKALYLKEPNASGTPFL